MIRGTVNSRREAVIALHLIGPSGTEADNDAVIDSGYSGALTLPASTIANLDLAFQSQAELVLGDGSITQFDQYFVEVEWEGSWKTVLASAIGDVSLVGMKFLVGHELRIEVMPGGIVEVKPLP